MHIGLKINIKEIGTYNSVPFFGPFKNSMVNTK